MKTLQTDVGAPGTAGCRLKVPEGAQEFQVFVYPAPAAVAPASTRSHLVVRLSTQVEAPSSGYADILGELDSLEDAAFVGQWLALPPSCLSVIVVDGGQPGVGTITRGVVVWRCIEAQHAAD